MTKKARRFDIAPVGESLLSDIRSRSGGDRPEKQLLKMFALQFGLSLANNVFQDKAKAFSQNERVRAARIKFNSAQKAAEATEATQAEIANSGKSPVQYFTDLNRPIVLQGMSESMKEELVDEDAYNAYITSKAREFGIKQAEMHRQGLEAAGQLATPEMFEASILARNTRPTNLMDFAVNGVTNFFKGKSQSEIDDEAFAAIEAEANDADMVRQLRRAFMTTKDLPGSYAYANDPTVFPDRERTKPVRKVDTHFSYDAKRGNVTIADVIIEEDELGNENIVGRNADVLNVAEMLSDEDKTKADFELVKIANATFNFAKDTANHLTRENVAVFNDILVDKGIIPTNIKNMTEYSKAARLYSEFVRDSSRLRDKVLEQKEVAYVAGLAESLNQISNKIVSAQALGDPDAKVNAFTQQIQEFKNVQQALQQQPEVPATIDFNDLFPNDDEE